MKFPFKNELFNRGQFNLIVPRLDYPKKEIIILNDEILLGV